MEEINFRDLLALLKRRKVVFFATTAVLFVIAGIYGMTWSSYRSVATVQILQSDISSNMINAPGMTQADVMRALADQHIQQVQQKITSTSSLIEVITKYDLYANARLTKPMSDIVDGMRKQIKLEVLSAGDLAGAKSSASKADQPPIAFTLQFTYGDPLKTQQVTNELMSRFLDEDLKQRRTQTSGTSTFMDSQLKALETTMLDQEKRIADFRAQHPDNRPEALALNQQLMASGFQNILAIETQMAALDKTRADLRTQLVSIDPYSKVIADGQMLTTPSIQLKALQARYSSIKALYSADHPDVVKLRHQIEALQKELGQTEDTAQLQSQLNDARTKLTAAEASYGAGHPDVQALRRQVASLEDRLATLARDPTPHTAIKTDADNPAYLMLTAQLQAADQQYKSLASQRDSLRQQYERYQQNVAQSPAIEQQMANLTRDYENAQLRYREMKEKKLTADMRQQLDQDRIGERLQVLDPPGLPTDTHPKRILLLLGGFILSVFGGLGGVLLREVASPALHGSRQLTRLLGAPPLVVIPHIFTRDERRTIRRRRLQVAAATAALIIIGGFAFDQFIMPLDVMGSVLARRLGMS